MPNLEPFKNVVRGNFFPVLFLGSSDMKDVVLLDLEQNELSEAMERAMRDGSMTFIGVAALTSKGEPRTALNVHLEGDAITTLTGAYLQHITNSIEAFAAKYANTPRTVANA